VAVTVTRGQAIAGKVGAEKETDEAKDAALTLGEAQKVEVDGRRQFFRLQDKWSDVIIDWITGLLIFNCLLVVFVGFGLISYEKTPWLINTFVTEIFLQVIGLGYIAARFLFPGVAEGEKRRRDKKR